MNTKRASWLNKLPFSWLHRNTTHLYLFVIRGHTLMKGRLDSILDASKPPIKPEFLLLKKSGHDYWVGTSSCLHTNPLRLFLQLPMRQLLSTHPIYYWPISSHWHTCLHEISRFSLDHLVLFLPHQTHLLSLLSTFILLPELLTVLRAQSSTYFTGWQPSCSHRSYPAPRS